MLLFRFENNLLQMLHFYPSVTHSCLSSLCTYLPALMTSYCKAPTLSHLNYPPHDIARSLGQLLPPPMTGFKYEWETPRASPSHRKVVSPQRKQTVAVFHVYPEERWEVFFLCYVDDHQRQISQNHPLLACCSAFSLQWTLLGLFYEFIFPSQLRSDLNFPKNHFLAILSFSYRTVDSECHGLSQKIFLFSLVHSRFLVNIC